jgi:hypothetical protein
MRRRELNDFDVVEVDAGYSTPCHIPLSWRGEPLCLDPEGYSVLVRTIDGKRKDYRAHRVRFSEERGDLPEGMVPDHLCRNRACCNAQHMEAVTIAENNRRGCRTKVTATQVAEMRELYAAGDHTQAEVARLYGVSQSHACNIIRGNYWADSLSPAWGRVKERRAKGNIPCKSGA